MTNREKLNSMSDQEFAEWLCKQLWDNFDKSSFENLVRYNQVRNFLKMEYKDGDKE